MDEVDQTIARERPVQECTRPRPEGPKFTGKCNYCFEPAITRFCDVECRDLWQRNSDRGVK